MTFTDDFNLNDYINDEYIDDEQDAALVADRHLFENGPDLFGGTPGNHLAPGSSLVGQTFDFPQDSTGLSTQGVNGDPYMNYTAPNPESEGVGRTIIIDPVNPELRNTDPDLFNAGTDFVPTPVTDPTTSAAVLDDSYVTIEQQQQQQQWETSAIESMQPFLPLQSEWQPGALVEEWSTNQAEIGLVPSTETQLQLPDSQQVQGPQAQNNFIPAAAIQLLQTAEPVDSQLLHQPTRTDSPIEDESSPDVPLPSKPRTKHNTCRTRTPAKRDPGLIESEDAITGLSFSSLRDAEVAMTSRYVEHDWEPPAPDDSIPNTHIERSQYVLDMLTAFQDISACKDNQSGYSFIKRWLTADYYNVQDIEKVCWHILSVAERLHTEGPSALNIFCAEAQRKVYVSRNLTFKERIEAICDCLKYTKNMCDNLMKAEGIETLVGSPKVKMNAARTMVPQNAKRQQWMAQGRSVDPTHVPSRAGRKPVAVQAPVQVEETAPPKRKRKTKQPKRTKGVAKSQSETIGSAQICTSLDASLLNTTPSQPNAPANGYTSTHTRAPPQITSPPLSSASVDEPSELSRRLSAGLEPSFEKLPTTPAPLPARLSLPSEPSVTLTPLKSVRLNPAPTFDALAEDGPAQPPASEPSQPVRKPRVKVRRELQALLADGDHSKAVSEAHSLLRIKRATKATTDKAPKTKAYLKSVDDKSNSDSESEETARPIKRQRTTGESARSKKPKSDIARCRRPREAKSNTLNLWDLLTKPASEPEYDDDTSLDDGASTGDGTLLIKHKSTRVVKPATRFPPPSMK
ncbi:hypothetical protein B5807_02275 [Epicoccum nigrum]|uniref:Uncharacterized protein n=1 Tax=Epicoccum nigrum TaxID=105696 RepID=A0A1Y2MAF5_EPING|nr:hypothetical protein B5807_02275 [Epicoccum nigrum]